MHLVPVVADCRKALIGTGLVIFLLYLETFLSSGQGFIPGTISTFQYSMLRALTSIISLLISGCGLGHIFSMLSISVHLQKHTWTSVTFSGMGYNMISGVN